MSRREQRFFGDIAGAVAGVATGNRNIGRTVDAIVSGGNPGVAIAQGASRELTQGARNYYRQADRIHRHQENTARKIDSAQEGVYQAHSKIAEQQAMRDAGYPVSPQQEANAHKRLIQAEHKLGQTYARAGIHPGHAGPGGYQQAAPGYYNHNSPNGIQAAGMHPSEYRQNGPQADMRFAPSARLSPQDAALHRTMRASEITANMSAPRNAPGLEPPSSNHVSVPGAKPLPGKLDGSGPASMHVGLPGVQADTIGTNRIRTPSAENGVTVTPVADRGKIDARPLREEFKEAADRKHARRPEHNGPAAAKVASAAPAAKQHDAPAETKIASAAPAKLTEDTRNYTTVVAQKGDSLWKLAETMYGKDDPEMTQKYVNAVAEANGMDAKSASKIHPGQEIKFPDTPRVGANTPDVAKTMIAEQQPAAAPAAAAAAAQNTVSSAQWSLMAPGGA